MSENQRLLGAIIGLATLGCSIIGVASFLVALIAFFNRDFLAAGVCLIAAALSFGLLANAVLRS